MIAARLAATEAGADVAAFAAETTDVTADLAATETGADLAAFVGTVAQELPVQPPGGASLFRDYIQPIPAKPRQFDDRDILELMPIIAGVLNARR